MPTATPTLPYLFAAFALTWLGICLYMWTLRRSVRRLTDEIAMLSADDERRAQG